ncbi:hypothetical protein [Actinacidiphila glaucinigra]|uniref:hypothetical protein n=1 Tax=Actinacidiphila glaucinigra TaxID=235986 RepID=UPI003D8B5B6B
MAEHLTIERWFKIPDDLYQLLRCTVCTICDDGTLVPKDGAGWTLMPRVSQAAVKAREIKTSPRSMTIGSGMTTGRAAVPARRSSSVASCWWGSAGCSARWGVRGAGRPSPPATMHGFGRAGAQDSGEDGAGGDVDGDGEFGAGQGAVVEESQDVQAGGVDLDLLAGPQRHRGGEGAPVEAGGGWPDGPCGEFAGAGEGGHEPVQRGLRRRRDGVRAVPAGKDLVDQRQAVEGRV